ncbi:MAG TPA: C4-type zinc ribbon domain-containing protein [Polyangiaceae bacterium]|nr:C4-type zinc ribbon domain-containing protein [Polyangiaceae bacterium]
MTIQSEIAALESLAEVDAALSVIEQEILQEREALAQKKVQLSQLESKLAKSKTSVDEMERTRGELVQDARQISLQMDRSREKSGRARTERESNAAQREIEELRKLYRDREVEIQKLTNLVDQARQDMDTSGSEREQVLGAIGSTEGETASKLAQLEQQAAEKRGSRAEFIKGINPVTYRRYEMIRQRLGSAVSHTVDGTCAVCHLTLPPMTFQKLRRGGDLDQCPSCRRIIYFRASSEAAGSEPANGAS